MNGVYSVRDFKAALTRAVFDVHDRSGAFLDTSPDDVLFGCLADGLARDAESLALLLRLVADAWRTATAGGTFCVATPPAVEPQPPASGKRKPVRKSAA